jgi:GTP cyclohydrolase I
MIDGPKAVEDNGDIWQGKTESTSIQERILKQLQDDNIRESRAIVLAIESAHRCFGMREYATKNKRTCLLPGQVLKKSAYD